jgi:hypothetical protein
VAASESCPTLSPVHHLEFTIEPFVEGRPGPHVVAAVDAARGLGVEVDFGPFGSGCTVSADLVPALVAAVTRAALEHGATHVSLHVSALPADGGPA